MAETVSAPDDVLERLTRLYPKAIETGLTRTLRILSDLGDPHLRLPPVIHVAGTNGKGSTIAFLRAMLEFAGKTVHVMTSPHLVRFNERIVIAGNDITDTALAELMTRVERINAGKPVTFFEITTAAGFLAFTETPADFCLIETGMGGRLDSTNVIANPAISVITSISRDHTQFLGHSLTGIATEKAGIMKQGRPCVIGPQPEASVAAGVTDVFVGVAETRQSPLYRHGADWTFDTEDGFRLTHGDRSHSLPAPGLTGAHQFANAATAAMTLILLEDAGFPVGENFLPGIAAAHWPARLQRIENGPLADFLPDGWELWLDGGHNEGGGRVLAEQAELWKAMDGKPLHGIFGMLTTKDPEPFFDHLRPFLVSAFAVPIVHEKLAFDAAALALRLGILEADNVGTAIERITAMEKNPGRILIAGSLYLAGSVLRDYPA